MNFSEGSEIVIHNQALSISVSRSSYVRIIIPALLIGVLLLIPLLISDPIFLHMMILIFLYSYLTISWNVVGGLAGQLSLGHTAYTGIGAYTSTLLFIQFGVSPWIGMFIGGLFSAVAAVTIGYPCFKLRGAYFALATIGFVETLRIIFENTQKIFGIQIHEAQGMTLPLKGHSWGAFQFMNKANYYYIILVMMLVALFITFRVAKSKLGYNLFAIKDDVDAATTLGVDVSSCRLKATALSAFLTGIGGTFYAQLILFIDPVNVFGLYFSMELVFIAVIGGRGTLLGPVFGSFLLIPLTELTRIYLGGSLIGLHLLLFGFILMVVMLFLPRGINDPLMAGYNWLIAKLENNR